MVKEYTMRQIHALAHGKLRAEQTNVVNVTSDYRKIRFGIPIQFVSIADSGFFLPTAYTVFYNAGRNAIR